MAYCQETTCSSLFNSRCVFYEGVALPYTGINTNDSLQTALQDIEDVIASIISGGGSGGSSVWGDITGTITDQSDLITYLSTNYTPQSRILTINGTAFDLSANRSWNVGVVTSIGSGVGISIGGTSAVPIITNTLPDQTVILNSGVGISVTGTYPNFTITNTSPSLGGTVTSVTGTAARITSTGGNTPVIDISGSYIGQASITTVGTLIAGSTGAGFTINLTTSTKSGVLPIVNGGTGLSTIAARSIWVANTLNTVLALTPSAGQSIRINAGNTAWEAYTPGGGIAGSTGAVDNAILRADGAGGSTLQSSNIILSDAGDITWSASLAGALRTFTAQGSDIDIGFAFIPKGSGGFDITGIAEFIPASTTVSLVPNTTILGQGDITIITLDLLTIGGASATSGTAGDLYVIATGADGTAIKAGDLTLQAGASTVNGVNAGNIFIDSGTSSGTGLDGNIGFFAPVGSFGNGQKVLSIGNATANATSSPTNSIILHARNSSDGSANSTLALYLEQAVEAVGTFTASHKIKVWINNVEYWLNLDQV